MIGVDADEESVKTDRTLVEGDQRSDGFGGHIRNGQRHGLTILLVEGFAGSEEKSLEVVARGGAGFHLHGRGVPVFQNLDEGCEKIKNPFAQLLDIGVLVRGPLVAVHGDALIYRFSRQIEFLAEGFHHQLLEISTEEEEAVLVGQDDHVLGSLAAGGVVPHRGKEGCRIVGGFAGAGDAIHFGGAFQHFLNVDSLQGGGEEADGGELAGATTHPVPHWELRKPFFTRGGLRQFAAFPGDGHGVFAPSQPCLFKSGFRLKLSIAGFLRGA